MNNKDLEREILKYLSGSLNDMERISFEQKMATDEMLATEVELFRLERDMAMVGRKADLRAAMKTWQDAKSISKKNLEKQLIRFAIFTSGVLLGFYLGRITSPKSEVVTPPIVIVNPAISNNIIPSDQPKVNNYKSDRIFKWEDVNKERVILQIVQEYSKKRGTKVLGTGLSWKQALIKFDYPRAGAEIERIISIDTIISDRPDVYYYGALLKLYKLPNLALPNPPETILEQISRDDFSNAFGNDEDYNELLKHLAFALLKANHVNEADTLLQKYPNVKSMLSKLPKN